MVTFNEESFETEFSDFELELIKVAKEREKVYHHRSTSEGENHVNFQDDVEIHQLCNGSHWNDTSTTDGKFNEGYDKRLRILELTKSEKIYYSITENNEL